MGAARSAKGKGGRGGSRRLLLRKVHALCLFHLLREELQVRVRGEVHVHSPALTVAPHLAPVGGRPGGVKEREAEWRGWGWRPVREEGGEGWAGLQGGPQKRSREFDALERRRLRVPPRRARGDRWRGVSGGRGAHCARCPCQTYVARLSRAGVPTLPAHTHC